MRCRLLTALSVLVTSRRNLVTTSLGRFRVYCIAYTLYTLPYTPIIPREASSELDPRYLLQSTQSHAAAPIRGSLQIHCHTLLWVI